MLTISHGRCIKATKNGFFRVADLSSGALTYDDMVFIAEYLRVTPVSAVDISMIITEENVRGLKELSQIISQKDLVNLTFRATQTTLHLEPSNNVVETIINYFNNKPVKNFNKHIYDAMVRMVRNKSLLRDLTIDLAPIETPISNSQSYKFSKSIQNAPLSSLDLNFMVNEDAKLPILDKSYPNHTLTHLKLQRLTFGRDMLNSLQNANALNALIIEDMQFHESDFQKIDAVLKGNERLVLFSLSKTNIGQIDCGPLFDSLKDCPSIAVLKLAENNLSLANSTALCDYLASNSQNLVELDLYKNTYMAPDAMKIAHALATNTQIERLIVTGNYIEDEGLRAIIEMAKANKQITALSIANTCRYRPSDETIQTLCTLLRDPDCQLRELNFVQNLHLNQLKMVCEAILANKTLTQVNLKYNFDSILGIIYKMKIEEHLDGLEPLVLDFDFGEAIETAEKAPITSNSTEPFFSPQKQTKTEEELVESVLDTTLQP